MKLDLVRSERKENVELRLKKRNEIIANNNDLFQIIKTEAGKWKKAEIEKLNRKRARTA